MRKTMTSDVFVKEKELFFFFNKSNINFSEFYVFISIIIIKVNGKIQISRDYF